MAAGHLDLTVAVRMDWHEGFQIYGEHGSVVGKLQSLALSQQRCRMFFSPGWAISSRLGADAHFYRLQLEAFADTILRCADEGATVEDGPAAVRALVAIARSTSPDDAVRLADVKGSI